MDLPDAPLQRWRQLPVDYAVVCAVWAEGEWPVVLGVAWVK